MFFDLIFLLRRIKACAAVLHDNQMEIILPDCCDSSMAVT